MAVSKKRHSRSFAASFFSFLPLKTSFFGFVPRFAVFFGVPYVLLHVLPLAPLLESIAAVESAMLQWAGVASAHFGAVLSSNAAWFQIVPDCSGLVMVILLGGLMWSTPVRRPERFFVVFAPMLFLFNFVRLFAVVYAGGVYGQGVQDAAHLGLWLLDAALVLGLWWVAFSSGPQRPGRKVAGLYKTRRLRALRHP